MRAVLPGSGRRPAPGHVRRHGFDGDTNRAKASRRATLKSEAAAHHEQVFAPHFPYPGVGTVQAKGQGFVWVPASLGTPATAAASSPMGKAAGQ